jgi:methionine biosynthesis protein MetW
VKDFYEDYWEHREEIDHLYEDWKPKRLQITSAILEAQGCDTILDVGCGEGTLGKLAPDECSMYGVDISETALEMADKHYIATAQADIEDDNIVEIFDANFDAVVCLEVLEHLFQPNAVLEKLSDDLDSGTTVIASVPNFVFWRHRMDILQGKIPDEYTLYAASEHISHFTPGTFRDLLTEPGIKVNKMIYDTSYPIIPDSMVPDSLRRLLPGVTARQIVAIGEVQ